MLLQSDDDEQQKSRSRIGSCQLPGSHSNVIEIDSENREGGDRKEADNSGKLWHTQFSQLIPFTLRHLLRVQTQ